MALIDEGLCIGPVLIRDSVVNTAHNKLVKMSTVPSHGRLKDDREFGECYVLWNDQAAPDGRLNFLQLDP